MSFHELGPQRIDQEPDFQQRMAQFYVNIAMSRILMLGAALTFEGVVAYPCPFQKPQDLPNETLAAQFEAGHVVTVHPKDIGVAAKSPSHPPKVFIIPPDSCSRLAIILPSSKRGSSYFGFLTGFNEDGKPIIDYFTRNWQLNEGFKAAAKKELEERKFDSGKIGIPLLTLTNEAFRDIGYTMGLKELNDYVIQLKRNAESI